MTIKESRVRHRLRGAPAKQRWGALLIVASACAVDTPPVAEKTKIEFSAQVKTLVKKFDQHCDELIQTSSYPKEPLQSLYNHVNNYSRRNVAFIGKNEILILEKVNTYLAENNFTNFSEYIEHIISLIIILDGGKDWGVLERFQDVNKKLGLYNGVKYSGARKILPIFLSKPLPHDFFALIFGTSPCLPVQIGAYDYPSYMAYYGLFTRHEFNHIRAFIDKDRMYFYSGKFEKQLDLIKDHYKCGDVACVREAIHLQWNLFLTTYNGPQIDYADYIHEFEYIPLPLIETTECSENMESVADGMTTPSVNDGEVGILYFSLEQNRLFAVVKEVFGDRM